MRALLLTLLCFTPACTATHRWFAPRENQNGEGPEGHPAAVYVVRGERAAGEVRVWSAGSSVHEDAGGSRTQIHLGFELENTGEQPLQLDLAALRIDGVRADHRRAESLPPARHAGSIEAAPATTARFDAWFEPGADIAPRQVDAFAARFVVRCAGETLCSQVTPFEPYADDPYYYYPYRYYPGAGPWGWYGYGWYGPPWFHYHCH